MDNQNLHYQLDQSLWGENQNHSSNQGNRQGFAGLQMVDQYQLGRFSNWDTQINRIDIWNGFTVNYSLRLDQYHFETLSSNLSWSATSIQSFTAISSSVQSKSSSYMHSESIFESMRYQGNFLRFSPMEHFLNRLRYWNCWYDYITFSYSIKFSLSQTCGFRLCPNCNSM